MKVAKAAALALLAGGCATTAGADGETGFGSGITAIGYETGPCHGTCPAYKVTVRADGSGTFEGRRFTAVMGERRFRLSFAQYRAFARQLEPLRPAREPGRPEAGTCRTGPTDPPSVEVTWDSVNWPTQTYYFYHGCDRAKNHAIARRLRAAPRLLPIGDYIGTRR